MSSFSNMTGMRFDSSLSQSLPRTIVAKAAETHAAHDSLSSTEIIGSKVQATKNMPLPYVASTAHDFSQRSPTQSSSGLAYLGERRRPPLSSEIWAQD